MRSVAGGPSAHEPVHAARRGSLVEFSRVALIGAPTDVGAGARGGSMGPEALRVAGLQDALESLGLTVVDRGDVAGPRNPVKPPREGYRHLDEVAAWCHAVREAVGAALDMGELPLVLGGDHSLAIGSIAAVARWCRRRGKGLYVLWLDAHADYNVPATSPSGNIHGMPAAVISGHGHPKLLALGDACPIVAPASIVQIGVRSVDAHEKALVVRNGSVTFDMRQVDELGMRRIMERALERVVREDAHLHVSFDVDFLDPAIAPGVATVVPGGPNYREAQLCMEMLHDSGRVGSVDVVELNPAADEKNRSARLAVELVQSLFGKRILA
ncbi:arginase [Anaeromyxobacter terrae]|uniref:arginase n=1 Tax=Anaeromyxobacter terrae TaxID=2925406 RepID=UPI001F579473|nr:arginase [Anaeromyxobacter sp. SG22]